VTKKWPLCHFFVRVNPDNLCFVGPDASVWVRQTSFRLTFQADFAANCKIWDKGYLTIGSSSETAGFVIDNLLWWCKYGINQYPDAKNILLLCDVGGVTSFPHHVFKKELMHFAAETGLSVIVYHYPPYCSRRNPIEHRLFCHVHKAMSGVIFDDYQTIQKAIG
jgi:hypothetical protein